MDAFEKRLDYPEISPLCRQEVGSCIHCIWRCPLILKFWDKVSTFTLPMFFLPAETPPANCLSCSIVRTTVFIFVRHPSASLCMLLGSRHPIALTTGIFRGLFSCTFWTILTRPCMHSFLKVRTESSPTLLPGLLWSAWQILQTINRL